MSLVPTTGFSSGVVFLKTVAGALFFSDKPHFFFLRGVVNLDNEEFWEHYF